MQESITFTDKEHKVKPWRLPKHQDYLFTNANIVNTLDGSILENHSVLISGGLIRSVYPTANHSQDSSLTPNSPIKTIDLTGKYLTPGLIDSHVHLMAVPGFSDLSKAFGNPFAVSAFRQPYVCGQMLSRGFTTVRDCGGATLALKEAIEDGVFPGPRLFISCHALSQTGGHGDIRGPHSHTECCGGANGDLGRICDGVPDCIKATREQIRTGADFIKIMGGGGVSTPTDKLEHLQFTSEEMKAMTTVAANADMWATAHAYTPASIRHAITNGCKGIEHGNLLDVPTAKMMAEKDIFLTPTLITYAEMKSPEWPGYLPPESLTKNDQVLRAGIDSLKIASEAGVTICFGTDLLGPLGAAQTREFAIRAQVLGPLALLQTATINPARMLRQEGKLGRVEEGYIADLLVLNQSPLEDILVFDRPEEHLLVLGHYRPQRHVVGHGRLGATASRNSSSKNLAKLTKVTPANAPNDATHTTSQRHHPERAKSGELLEPASSSPRPHMKRNASAFVVRNQSHSALKKNFSSGHLPRHASSKNVTKAPRHPPAPNKRTVSNRSENSEPPSPAHHTVRFALGDGDEVGPTDEHDGDGEWTEESASASPHTTRSNTPARSDSIISEGPMTGRADAHDSTSEAGSSNTVIHDPTPPPAGSASDRTLTTRLVNGSNSHNTPHTPDADAITSRLLQRAHSHNTAPQVTNVSAVVTSEPQGSKTVSHSQSSTLQDGTPGRDLVSRFIDTNSSSGTPKDGSLLPPQQQRRPDSADLDGHKRNKSTPNFVEPGSSPTSSFTSRTLTRGTATPSELPPSRTMIKMQLMRASSNIEQLQKGIPAVLPRANAAHFIGQSGSFNSNQGVAPQIQGLFNQTAKEYQVVRRFRNPVAEAIHRLGEIPGTSRRNTHIPRQQRAKPGYVNGGDGKYGLSQSYRSREERHNETDAQQARHGYLAPSAAQRHATGYKSRVSFDLPRADEDEDDVASVGSDDGRIVRDEAYEICRRLWEIGDGAEGG
ncbi:hypothetical protein FKW77_005996 [Venturia effusa]|uniref:Amidohydrolase-related domain-containing protein n=1 Tax=Venturia effusa TaxID=50376 RepID=A0A517L9E8_9PEZI|nr:hypothetical protein FKW77_005996 [Venturia effusa]